MLEDDKENSVFEIDGTRLRLLKGYRQMFLSEHDKWKKWYLPQNKQDIRNKIVLDVGAGCGESAYFFLKYGAEKVICIEPDKKVFDTLVENSRVNSWNVELVNDYFDINKLSREFDFLKMDCEGCEEQLLNLESIKPHSVIEVHSSIVSEKLERKFNLNRIYSKRDISILRNF
ncbi:MAG: class I SAM-dependent methyltransferase [Nitrososphaerales archaeon]